MQKRALLVSGEKKCLPELVHTYSTIELSHIIEGESKPDVINEVITRDDLVPPHFLIYVMLRVAHLFINKTDYIRC